MLMQIDTRPAPTDKPAPDQKPPRFLDSEPPRRVPLGRVRTDDEARLAAEIEKLR
jgi:hypothetical protein